ncbi:MULTISPECIES: diacylglycerol kinase [unclassified Wolbachia]|uniref:Diacylglycerol kinase n=1 Tax=Wolbachia endosymbiont of Oeneis ivallda TaxID=3171168 RepID=A0AAU7YPQ5_9RICK|nr:MULTISPECIES: diacylglycerol kinase [unclassified Wolbachia]OAM06142.1 MAG: diacylglycerol kinase [Wolbachia endosymbiont of Dactylopius coccus]TNK94570.1 diacylglycerol kinase [Wolbachia endosymbiont of Leptopilina clavipes]
MKKSITRLIKAIQYSCEGIKSAFVSEVAFRQELLLFIICVSTLFVLDVSNLERAVMVSSLFLVLIVEIINTAFETIIERISSEQHILSKKVKDLGSAAVFLSLINFLITWMIILI